MKHGRWLSGAMLAAALVGPVTPSVQAQCSGLDTAYQIYSSSYTTPGYKKRLGLILKYFGPLRSFVPGRCVSTTLGAAGGTLVRADRSAVMVPAGILAKPTVLSIDDAPAPQAAAMGARLAAKNLAAISAVVAY